ncbi:MULTISPECIES: MerR family transcriptional regulator [Paenibacillus]|uniref:helix-turn-helix domain-containing protein n=1 Tax=Paenibacillus TaxID=44249 RepID=UPI002FE2D782
MKKEITISELAKLMNVSVHQIRYFEEKGVLQPAYTDSNQYRMYGMTEIYRLAHILLLRKLEVPVKSIGESMSDFSTDQYRELLRQSLRDIDAEVVRLQELQRFIEKVLQEQQNFSQSSTSSSPYQIKQREMVFLEQWFEVSANLTLHAKLLAEQAKRATNLFESDIHYIYTGSDSMALCLETEEPGDLSLPGGYYLSKQSLIYEEAELDRAIEAFYAYADAQSYILAGPLILIERSYLSLFSPHALHFEIQSLMEKEPGSQSEKGGEWQ